MILVELPLTTRGVDDFTFLGFVAFSGSSLQRDAFSDYCCSMSFFVVTESGCGVLVCTCCRVRRRTVRSAAHFHACTPGPAVDAPQRCVLWYGSLLPPRKPLPPTLRQHMNETAIQEAIQVVIQTVRQLGSCVTKRLSSWACIGNPKPEQETIEGTHAQETPAYQRRPTTHCEQGRNQTGLTNLIDIITPSYRI